MQVHFITSRPSLMNDIQVLRQVIDTIHDKDHGLALDWIEAAYRRQVVRKDSDAHWGWIYKRNLEAIVQADVVIAETSYEDLAVGYQIATAIQLRKPILLLRRDVVDRNAFAIGIEDNWVSHAEYTDKSLASLVESFLDDNDLEVRDLRFNFFMNRRVHNYLRWVSFKTGKTKAEILRDLLKQDITRNNY